VQEFKEDFIEAVEHMNALVASSWSPPPSLRGANGSRVCAPMTGSATKQSMLLDIPPSIAIRSNACCMRVDCPTKQNNPKSMDCFVAEPVIGRAYARPVGSSQ